MALAEQIGGKAVVTGGQVSAGLGTFTNWTVERVKVGDIKIDAEELTDEDGALYAILQFQRHDLIELTLISKGLGGTVTQAKTDFPKGKFCGITGLTTYYVESSDVEVSKSAVRVTASLRLIGITGVSP